MKVLVETGGRITELDHEPFKDEARLPDLGEQPPRLVPAETSDDESRSIRTIGREMGVPSGSTDLLLDSTGCLWVAEIKLSRNPELRKQVVGRVLAYTSDVGAGGLEPNTSSL